MVRVQQVDKRLLYGGQGVAALHHIVVQPSRRQPVGTATVVGMVIAVLEPMQIEAMSPALIVPSTDMTPVA